MFSTISYILSLIPIIQYPQGGGINMFSMLPLLLVSIVYSREAGLSAGLITGILKMLIGGYIVHPAQIMLDYILCNMALGLSDIFGKNNKFKIICGCAFSVMLNVLSHFLAGYIFFKEFAPEKLGAFLYSLIYNFSGHGIEGILCIVIISILPIKRFRQIAK
jgi:thiamine transporter